MGGGGGKLEGMRHDAGENFFSLFGIVPAKLRVDGAGLEREFYAMSRRLHPDRFAARPKEEQEGALRASSELNDAYRTLKDPIARTHYLLKLEGVEMEEQSKAATDAARASGGAKKQVAPPELLEEAFELNMQLEEMRANKQFGEDDPGLRKELEGTRANFEGMLQATQTELEGLWERWDAAVDAGDAAGRAKARDEMVALLNRRSYVRNLVRDVHEALV